MKTDFIAGPWVPLFSHQRDPARDEPEAGPSPLPAGADWPEVMTVAEVARVARVNRNTVYDCIARRELRACRAGRTLRVHRDAVLEWLRGDRRVSRSSRRLE